MNNILRKALIVSLTILGLFSCGPKEFHEHQDYSNAGLESAPGTEAKITNPINSTPASFVSNNTVAIISNFNEKTLEYFGYCSGVRLTSNIILTAAHCISKKEKMRVIFGTSIRRSLREPESVFEVADIVVHESSKNQLLSAAERRHFDVALIKLKKSLPNMNDDYSLISQFEKTEPTAHDINTDSQGDTSSFSNLHPLIAGFGIAFHKNAMNGSTRFVGTLNEAPVYLRNDDYTQKIIALNQQSLSQACVGDSGGPLYIWRDDRYYLQAIAISIKDNEKTDPFVNALCEKESSYLNLDFLKDWILDKSRILSAQ